MHNEKSIKQVKRCYGHRNEKGQTLKIEYNVLSENLDETELKKISLDLHQLILDNAFKLGQSNNA